MVLLLTLKIHISTSYLIQVLMYGLKIKYTGIQACLMAECNIDK